MSDRGIKSRFGIEISQFHVNGSLVQTIERPVHAYNKLVETNGNIGEINGLCGLVNGRIGDGNSVAVVANGMNGVVNNSTVDMHGKCGGGNGWYVDAHGWTVGGMQ